MKTSKVLGNILEKARKVGETKVGKDGKTRVWSKTPSGFDWRRVKGGKKTSSGKQVNMKDAKHNANPEVRAADKKEKDKKFYADKGTPDKKPKSYKEDIDKIEQQTDFDVLNHTEFEIDVINRFDSDDEVKTITIGNKTTKEIIDELNGVEKKSDAESSKIKWEKNKITHLGSLPIPEERQKTDYSVKIGNVTFRINDSNLRLKAYMKNKVTFIGNGQGYFKSIKDAGKFLSDNYEQISNVKTFNKLIRIN